MPAIDSFWQDKQAELLEDLQDEQLVLLGNISLESFIKPCYLNAAVL